MRQVIILIVTVTALFSCTDKSYLIDGGKANPYYEGTMLEFLKSRPDLFTKLVKVIEITGMEDVFTNEDITFFAPTDYSIQASVDQLNTIRYNRYGQKPVTDLSQIKAETWEQYLQMYIVDNKYLLRDVAQVDTVNMAVFAGQAILARNSKPMNMGVVYGEANGVRYAGYRQLLYSMIYDVQSMDMQNAYVATSDIQPVNGIVHVIRFTDHKFGFTSGNFAYKAIEDGIIDN
jgi:hypothetical protein